jgi:hypothetical protein
MKEFRFVVPVKGHDGRLTVKEFVFSAAGFRQARELLSQQINPNRQPA